MQPLEDGLASPTESIQSLPMAASTMRLPKQRQVLASDAHPLAQSEATLPYRDRRSNPSAASLFASTLTPPGSRSASPSRPSSVSVSGSSTVFGGGGTFRASLMDTGAAETPGDPLNLILHSFVPHIAVYGSRDVDELVRDKGFAGGLGELLRPFGERVQGKVTIRDSSGGARSWEDFSVRFVRLGDRIEEPEPASGSGSSLRSPTSPNGASRVGLGIVGEKGETVGGLGGASSIPSSPARLKRDTIAEVEAVVDKHLSYAEDSYLGLATPTAPSPQGTDADTTSPYYSLYLRRMLSGIPLSAHETFAHPVACVIAISSRNPTPIETLRNLYSDTAQGQYRLPPWVDAEYLRYYVLVHDEEKSDITKSLALFEQMKRHLGLHCHLLRLRSSSSAETDDDSMPLPRSDWQTASEELALIEKHEEQEDFEDPTRYIFDSDATAIRTFIREMVTQSIVPTMERNVSLWNDQVASRRRGISGRFMSLSKRFAFGGSSRSSPTNSSGGASSSNNFEAAGFYRYDTPEAIMRKLGDYAFMLRDWKLAMSTYDLLRGDFQNDKAWRHHAAANEMTALALLIMPQSMSSKARLDNINQLVEQAFYSYHTRCVSAYGAIRSLMLSVELLRLRGGPAVDDAVRWGNRLLEAKVVGPVGDALFKERLAICYAAKEGTGSQAWGSRRRKSALWSVLAAEAWVTQAKFIQAQRCLNEAREMYSLLPTEYGVARFALASEFMAQLQARLKTGLTVEGEGGGVGGGDESVAGNVTVDLLGDDIDTEVEVEHLADAESEMLSRRRSRRVSINAPGATGTTLESAPLASLDGPLVPVAAEGKGEFLNADGFS